MTAQQNAGHAAVEKGGLDRVAEQLRQPSRDAGDKYREEERGQPCEQKIDQGGLEHLFERCVDNAGGEIEQRRHRGRDVAHAEVNGKDRRKMHGAEAELFDDGNKDTASFLMVSSSFILKDFSVMLYSYFLIC